MVARVAAPHVASEIADLLGRAHRLTVVRDSPHGLFLTADPAKGDGAPVVLLPRNEAPKGAKPGDELEAFVYLDSDDRPIATLRPPRVQLGEVAFLRIADVTDVGAFADWGLVKQLLVPHAEQTQRLRVGDRHPIGLYLDRSSRLAGTMRVTEMLRDKPDLERGRWVEGEAWRREERIGVFVILEKRCVGLLPSDEPNTLARGEARRFRVSNVLADGRVEVSLRGLTSEVLEDDGQRIVDVLARRPELRVGDASSPDELRAHFGLSKKAFKRALGGLLKRGAVRLDEEGFVERSPASPTARGASRSR
ncbi:MAG: S1-like domain-containing RNA-binding protein [Polyangiaceae bacterium]